MSSKNFNGNPPKYINDFSKALASEVRILLAEVGQLRDERRALQFEIAELMSAKSKHGAGGEYTPDWRPPPEPQALLPPPPPPPPPIDEGPPGPARPAWRTVHKRAERKEKAIAKRMPPAIPAPSAVPPLALPRPNVPAWAQWKPNPLLSPAPVMAAPTAPLPNSPPPPSRSGLFGPPTPPPN
ncbi:uncharacterized protein EV420DRAFT_1641000 [Desarmillaria tabescens]|uniref:Uncharacterized protein n=1 Tax=Armillaria tabescens TaxID=1929756 RepID=A0AA39TN23_ARMTA|nr:uncharacterized protein EV420DRAFT_1641000 [Desarmillaria tabescens]KAK0460453.1 hypothetical protein EV420DRAFT_1641000 [Desarmillaria tabescens]